MLRRSVPIGQVIRLPTTPELLTSGMRGCCARRHSFGGRRAAPALRHPAARPADPDRSRPAGGGKVSRDPAGGLEQDQLAQDEERPEVRVVGAGAYSVFDERLQTQAAASNTLRDSWSRRLIRGPRGAVRGCCSLRHSSSRCSRRAPAAFPPVLLDENSRSRK